MQMTPQQVERWARTRQKGRARFVWLYGVLGWGVSVAILWSVCMAALQGWGRLPILLPVALASFPIGGYFFGALKCCKSEKQFQEATQDRTP